MLANTVRNRAFLFNGLCNYALHEKLNIHSSIEMFSFLFDEVDTIKDL